MTDIRSLRLSRRLASRSTLVQRDRCGARSPVPASIAIRKDGAQQVRFAFCKRDETLDEAANAA